MDSIKKKMRSLAQATEEAESVANSFDTETKATNEIADKCEEQVGRGRFNEATLCRV